jgi:hypothetical protein
MTDEKLEAFKLGDEHRSGLSKPASKAKGSEIDRDMSKSLGFQRIESMLEDEDPVEISQGLSELHRSVSELEMASATNRDKHEARKVMKAIELTGDLVDYLFQTKDGMAGGGA